MNAPIEITDKRAFADELTQEALKARLHYDPLTGLFTHRKTHRGVKAGDVAGCNSWKPGYPYVRIRFARKYYLAHRLVFLYMIGEMPPADVEIDHKDHVHDNNRWTNLRMVSHPTNGVNQRKYANNTSGVTGIRQRRNGKWRARIFLSGKHIDLGTFTDKEKAIAARDEAEKHFLFHENHGK